MKVCTKCGMTKTLEEYHKHMASRDGRKSWCKPCNIKAAADYVVANPDKVAATKSAYGKAHREQCNQRVKEWVARNPEKARVKACERSAKFRTTPAYSEFLIKNRPAIRLSKSKHKVKRRVAEQAATPAWADPDQMKLYFIYADALEMHVDHIVPIVSEVVCGLHWEGNFQLLTPVENITKGNRHWPDMP